MDQSFNWARPARSRVDHRVENRRSTQASCGATVGTDALWLSRPGKPCSVCSEIVRKAALSDYIEMLLDALARPINFSHHHTWIKLTARDFDGASPWLNEFIELAGGDEGLIDPSYHPSEVNWPITTRTISLDIDRPGNLAVSICRGLSPRDVRGRVSPSLPYPIMEADWFPRDGFASSMIFGRSGEFQWRHISAGARGRGQDLEQDWSRRIQLALGISQFLRTRWRVYLSNGGLGVTFPTDPVGVQEVFRLRDIPEGKERRAALRHWVTEHWRINIQDAREEILVREHLRGAQKFSWSGLNCRVTPSEEDFIREYDARIARIQAATNGTDRRPVEEVI